MEKLIIAVCGKGGVGKTSFSAMLVKNIIEAGIRPVLLIDADPAGGLTITMQESVANTLAGVRDQLINAARKGEARHMADDLDYLLLQSLAERREYSLLALGHSSEKGCFCPANQLLRKAIDKVAAVFRLVLIDAEAGIEQINRDVTRRVDRVVAIADGSRQSFTTVQLINSMVDSAPVSVISNRINTQDLGNDYDDFNIIGSVPEDDTVKEYNREGRSLLELPPDNAAVAAVRDIAETLGVLTDKAR